MLWIGSSAVLKKLGWLKKGDQLWSAMIAGCCLYPNSFLSSISYPLLHNMQSKIRLMDTHRHPDRCSYRMQWAGLDLISKGHQTSMSDQGLHFLCTESMVMSKKHTL